jgi:hypothetical protein
LLAAALRLADAGCHVFPCRTDAKQPATEHGLLDATRDGDHIRAWWTRQPNANIGVATEPSGLAVVDLDPPDGIVTWQRLLTEHRDTERTITARTPRGGFHLWYAADPDRPLRSTASQLAPRIDTRGAGGYVLVPPSRVAGPSYVWSTVPSLDRLPTVPSWILEALERPTDVGKRPQIDAAVLTPHSLSDRSSRYAAAALERELQAVLDAPHGTRNNTFNAAAYNLGTLVGAGMLDRPVVVSALRRAGEAVGLGDAEVDRTLRSGLGAGIANPRTVAA